MSSRIAFAGLSAARSRVARLAAGLQQAASGVVVQRAAAAIGAQIVAVAEQKTTAHMETGNARGSVVLTISGGLVQLSTVGYLRYHPWWQFRRGMPPFVLKRAALILAHELLAVLRERRELGQAIDAEAAEVVQEAEGAARRKAERAHDRKVKAREAREGR